MEEDTTPTPLPVLPRKTDYGTFIRIVEPGRHVYRTRVTAFKCVGLAVGVGGAVLMAWGPIGDLTSGTSDIGVAVGMVIMSVTLFAVSLVFVTVRECLEITPARARIWRRGMPFFSRDESWDIREIIGAEVGSAPIFDRAGMTLIYGVGLRRANSNLERLGAPLDDKASAAKMARDINESIRRARLDPERF